MKGKEINIKNNKPLLLIVILLLISVIRLWSLKGGVIASGSYSHPEQSEGSHPQFADNGNLIIHAASLTYSDIKDNDESKMYSFGIGASVGKQGGSSDLKTSTTKGTSIGNVSLGYGMHDFEQTTHATIGNGSVIIGGGDGSVSVNEDDSHPGVIASEEKQSNTLATINRDMNNAQEETKHEEVAQINVDIDTRIVGANGGWDSISADLKGAYAGLKQAGKDLNKAYNDVLKMFEGTASIKEQVNEVQGKKIELEDQKKDIAEKEKELEELKKDGASEEEIKNAEAVLNKEMLEYTQDAKALETEMNGIVKYSESVQKIIEENQWIKDAIAEKGYIDEELYREINTKIVEGFAKDLGISAKETQILLDTMLLESAGKNKAAPSNSTAFGLFQFTNDTWIDNVNKYGAKYGVDISNMSKQEILALRSDPMMSSQIALEFTRDNAKALPKQADINAGTLYTSHLLGSTGNQRLYDNYDNNILNNPKIMEQVNNNKPVFPSVYEKNKVGNYVRTSDNNITGKNIINDVNNHVKINVEKLRRGKK